MAPSQVYHGLIRALLSLAWNIMCVQLSLAAGKDQLTPGMSGTYFFYLFSVYVCLLSIIIIFAVRNLFNLFCFVLLCLDLCFILFCFFCFVLFRFCCCCFYVFFCFCVWIFGLIFSPLRHFPSTFYLFLRIAVTSYKQCQHFGRLH